MKKIVLIIFASLLLSGCAAMFTDLKTTKAINEGRIYIGMPKWKFTKVLSPPTFGIRRVTTEGGTKEMWYYGGQLQSNWNQVYTFYFDEDGKLIKWDSVQ